MKFYDKSGCLESQNERPPIAFTVVFKRFSTLPTESRKGWTPRAQTVAFVAEGLRRTRSSATLLRQTTSWLQPHDVHPMLVHWPPAGAGMPARSDGIPTANLVHLPAADHIPKGSESGMLGFFICPRLRSQPCTNLICTSKHYPLVDSWYISQ